MSELKAINPPLYLDYAASTPLDSRVLERMMPYLSSGFGNPSSPHAFGRQTRAALDEARDSVARFLHAQSAEVCFTSGGTEADNLAVIGAALNADESRREIVISSVEHHAVLRAAESLQQYGYRLHLIPVSSQGELDLDTAEKIISEKTALVSVMLVNNETGVVHPVKKVARMAHEAGVLMHTDAVQAAGVLRLSPADFDVDMLSISAHKFYGPKGVGALWVRRGVKLHSVIHGGAQERERRAGTENVAGLVGMGVAADIARTERQSFVEHITACADAFSQTIGSLSEIELHASQQRRIPSILNYGITDVDAELLLMRLDNLGIAASSGAACASGSRELSHVLQAMGFSQEQVKSSLRVSFGRGCTPDQCREAADVIVQVVQQMRTLTATASV